MIELFCPKDTQASLEKMSYVYEKALITRITGQEGHTLPSACWARIMRSTASSGSFDEMVREDLEKASRDQFCRESGFQVLGHSFE